MQRAHFHDARVMRYLNLGSELEHRKLFPPFKIAADTAFATTPYLARPLSETEIGLLGSNYCKAFARMMCGNLSVNIIINSILFNLKFLF